MSLGAYYQCHKNPVSFIRAIKSFKQYYPSNNLVVVNDGGYNYKEFCMNNEIHYNYIKKDTSSTIGLMFKSYDQCIHFLKNLWQSFDTIKEDYILLLEDDVRVLKHHTMPFLYSINGCNYNESLPECAIQLLKNKGYNGPFYYGGCGGTVLDKNFFKAIPFNKVEELLDQISHFIEMYASDLLISLIALYYGGTIGQYDEFAETWYKDINERYQTSKIAFLHQYKKDYEIYGVYPTYEELLELKDYKIF